METLPVLILNPHSRCNCRCQMCEIWKTTDAREIGADDLEKELPSIRRLQVRWVVLSGGEPLMHSDLWRLTAMLRELDVRITLLSSGLLLGRYAEALVKSVDEIIVSLDGPPDVHDAIRGVLGAFEMLASGVEGIRGLDSQFEISARCTVQRANFAHLTDTVETARSLHLNSISLLAADVDSSAFNRPRGWPLEKKSAVAVGPDDIAELRSAIERLIACGDCGSFIRESPRKLMRIVNHFRAVAGEIAPVAPRCNAPWNSAVIEADGAVRPCFFHPPIGWIGQGRSLDQVLSGPAAVAFRSSLNVSTNPTCQKCVCSLNWKQN
jgi:MoaA/NifB/PqqE/SkfB family radical SAM enzyme